jgi:phosphonate transport system ATP-binding protein
MVQSPRLILADEPVASLDPSWAEDVVGLLTGLTVSSGKTLVASLHSPDLIRKHFSRVIGLRSGTVQFDMPASDLTELMLDRLYDLNHHASPEMVGTES